MIRAQVVEVKKDHAEGRKVSGRRTILYDILTNNQISPHDKETERLVAESISVVGAGYAFSSTAYAIHFSRLMQPA